MRKLMMMAILASSVFGVAAIASTTPASAREYPWCIQSGGWGYPGECSYDTFRQCQAAASGRYVSCGTNPVFAFDRARRGGPAYRNPYRHGYRH